MAATTDAAVSAEFEQFLREERAKDLLRFTTAGSVDDGKSTLIGRLLYDSRNVYEDQLEAVTKASAGRNAGTVDLSLLTDGLRAEREQGITIDVAYRYFATARRKFIIADTPGHEQYTRNMVTGASTAELAIILVDARKGILPQSRRHTYISSLLGLPHLVIAINKMDLVDYSEQRYREIEQTFRDFLSQFDRVDPYFIPLSALAGDNVVEASRNMPWFSGPSLLEYLETVPVGERALHSPFRFPVQRVVRPDLDFRGYAGQIASGEIHVGDRVTVFPAGRSTTVKEIVTFDGPLQEAHAPLSVTLTLADEIDVVRGDLISASKSTPTVARLFDATAVWLNEQPLDLNKRYRLKHSTHQEWAEIKQIHHLVNINTLAREEAATLEMNQIGVVRIETARALYFDLYRDQRATGSFILIDPVSNATVAAGMISGAARAGVTDSKRQAQDAVTAGERAARWRHRGAIVHFGHRLDLAQLLERQLFERGAAVVLLRTWNPDWAQPLLASGVLALVADAAHDRLALLSPDSETDLPASELPSDAHDAAHSLLRVLERAQVLLDAELWTENDGI